MNNKSIINRIFLYILISAIVLGTTTTYLIASSLIKEYNQEHASKNQIYVDRLKETFEQNLFAIESTVNSFANALMIIDFHELSENAYALNDWEKEYTLLFENTLLGNLEFSNSIYVYLNPELDGDVHDVWITKEQDGSIIRHEEVPLRRYVENDNMTWFYVPRDLGHSLWLKPYTNRYGQLVSSYIVPIFEDDTYIGMIGMYLSFDDLKTKMLEQSIYQGDFFWIENEEHEIIHQTTDMELTANSLKLFTVFSSPLHNGWTLKYSVPTSETNKVMHRLIMIAIVTSLSFVIIIVLIFVRSRKKLQSLFTKIMTGIKNLETGDYDSKIEIEGDDELSKIAYALNDAGDQIKALNKDLLDMAFKNPVSGLCNKNKLNQKIGHMKNEYTLFAADLDNFKTINEVLGHEKGDQILKDLANKLKALTSESIELFHTSGDEFTLFVKEAMDNDAIDLFADKILNVFKTLQSQGDFVFENTCSIGIVRYPQDADTMDELNKYLEVALYNAKSLGKNTFVKFHPSLYKELVTTTTLETQFKHAVENNEIEVYYQPKVNIKTNKVLGVEALARWNHPEKGILPPYIFMHTAEKTGCIIPMGLKVLKKACEAGNIFISECNDSFIVSINMSSKQLLTPNIVEDIKRILNVTAFPADHVVIEVSENIFQFDKLKTIKVLNTLKELGIQISMDDFGSGYSSISTLAEMPLDALKISRHFINKLSTNETSKRLVQATIKLAHSLDLRVIAVGVETSDVLNDLILWGCDTMQGFYYAQPGSFKDTMKFIKDYNNID